jgi:hypothetical protein
VTIADAQVVASHPALATRALSVPSKRKRAWRGGLQRSEFVWAVAFIIPYAAVFLAFVAYPVVYGVWLGHDPALYAELLSEPIYLLIPLEIAHDSEMKSPTIPI